jgi:hypothetical protein
VSLHGLLKVSRVLGGKQDFGANITKLFDGATDRKSPAASLKALYGYASNTPGARNGRYTDPMLEGQVGNLPGTSKQQAQNSIRARCPSGHVPAAPSTRCVSSSRSALGTAVNPSYPRPWANRITRWRANLGSLGKIGHR